MEQPKIYVHGSYIGTTGYNNHTRDFFRELSKYAKIKIRNFTVGNSWSGYNNTPHDGETYLTDLDKSMLYKQILHTQNGNLEDFDIYSDESKNFKQDFNIVLSETNHHIFYQNYMGPKIAYNVWESTLQPYNFFEQLLKFDEIWVPSKWQRDCTINQGADPNKVKVVPEGVDVHTFYPETFSNPLDEYKDNRFKFLLMGRWDYRKSTKEIIESFLREFSPEEPVDLVVSIDNMWGEDMDGYKTTEDRLKGYGFTDERIKILHFPSRKDYIQYLKTGHVFVSCARSEGWNLPLIEAMACGTPSIYSNCSAQLEFAEGKGFPVKIVGERPANSNDYGRYTMSDLPGNYYEPDFEDLSRVMRHVYTNYNECKLQALKDSEIIRNEFSWENVGRIGFEKSMDFYHKINSEEYKNTLHPDTIKVSYMEGPKVEIYGERYDDYEIEFIDKKTNEVIHKSTIHTNMWTACSRKYYTDWIIKINGETYDEFTLNNKRVLISFESRSIGDTIAWMPYTVEFAKKHNCKVIVSTFHNNWFEGKEEYKDIEFILPGSVVDCHTVYRIGWFRKDNKWTDFEKYPNQVNLIPLQQTATDILGLDYKEINHGLNIQKGERPIENKYVAFGPNATAGCKEWDYSYWVMLSKMIKELGYDVITLTEKPYHIEGVKNIWGTPLKDVANYLIHAEAFVGLGSGLSWFNWALDKHTHMINGFSKEGHEFSTNITKIFNPGVCISCWNDSEFVFDSGDWDWCPVYKGTQKQHICQRSITPLQVFNMLKL